MGTEKNGFFFSEELPAPDQVVLKRISVEISRQNANLAQIKERMAEEAQAIGANAILGFVYGQKPHKGLKLLKLKWDTESWHGEGSAVVL